MHIYILRQIRLHFIGTTNNIIIFKTLTAAAIFRKLAKKKRQVDFFI